MDLSKAYDCLPHELIIAKLEAYGLDIKATSLIFSYLSGRKHRTKIGSSYSSWIEILRGVPQGSILGPLLFNIYLNDFFFITKSEVCNFADDNTIYSFGSDLDKIFKNLTNDMKNILAWFEINSLKANPSKFQFMVLGKTTGTFILKIKNTIIKSSSTIILLGITIDRKLDFAEHINNVCSNATYKLFALRRIRKYLNIKKTKALANAFIHSQFHYCPIIWMFCNKTSLKKINKLHHRILKVIYGLYDLTFQELLEIDGGLTIHQRHLQFLAAEVFKSINNLNPIFMTSFFQIRQIPYLLRKGAVVNLPDTYTHKYGINSTHFRACLLWNSLPSELKNCKTILQFKDKIRRLGTLPCNCTSCR